MASSLINSFAPYRFLLLAAALLALAVFFVHDGAPPAQAAHTLATPANFTVTPGDGQVSLTWDAVSDADEYEVAYRAQLSAGSNYFGLVFTGTSGTVPNLNNGQFYIFRIRARDTGGTHDNSAWTDWVTVMPQVATTTQVSNFSQTRGTLTFGHGTESGSQAFTTGTNSAGYTLSSIEVDSGTALNATAAALVRAELWSANADGSPNARLETLTVPSTLIAGTNSFTAPLGTVLAPETTYHIVFYTSTTAGQLNLKYLARDGEDSGEAAGWSIANVSHFIQAGDPNSPGSATWSTDTDGNSYVIAVKGAARAVGSGKPIWSATLNAADLGSSSFGCELSVTNCSGSGATVLSNVAFTYSRVSRTVYVLKHTNHATDSSRRLTLQVRPPVTDAAFKELTLHVGGRTLAVADATVTHSVSTGSNAVWASTGMTWAASDQIRMTLTIPEASANNNLHTLTASTNTSQTGTYTTHTLTPAFTAGTTEYDVTVGNAVTYAKLTPTVDDTGKATVQVGKRGTTLTTVGDRTASNAIALAVGDNILLARVTAENGDTRDYMVTIRRQSANANLSALRISTATSETGDYHLRVPLTPRFATDTTDYSLRVDHDNTHAKVSTTRQNSEATVQIGKTVATLTTVMGNNSSAPIALSLGANDIIVRVTAEDTSITRDYTVTVNVDGTPEAPTDLTVTPGSHSLSMTWTPPGVTVDGYDVHYTTKSTADLADDAEVGYYQDPRLGRMVNQNPARGWASLYHGHLAEPKYGHGGLTPGQKYRMRVRAYNSFGIGPWAVAPPPVWDATLEVANLDGGNTGCDNNDANATCTSKFTSRVFTYKGQTYWLLSAKSYGNGDFKLNFSSVQDMAALQPLTLRVGTTELSMADAGLSTSNQTATWTWNNRPGILPSGQSVNFYLFDPTAYAAHIPAEAPRTVTLSASPERVREGDTVTITATVRYDGQPTAIQEDLDVMLSTHLGTAESGDVDTLERISIGKDTYSASATIQTHRDGDSDDETFAVLIRWIPKSNFAKAGNPYIVWVTITEGDTAPPEPVIVVPQVSASGGDGTLHLSWSETSTEHSGYDVQYKHSSAADQAATAGDPETGWVDAGHTGTERSMTITGLTNWVDHDVRVRLTFPDGTGGWSDVVTAYPLEPVALGNPQTVTVTVSDTTPEEGETVTLTATLDERAPREGVTVQFWAYGSHIGADGTELVTCLQTDTDAECEAKQVAKRATVWRDYRLSPRLAGNDFGTTPMTLGPGQTTATATLLVVRGHGNEGTEGIRVYATARVPDPDHQYGRRLKSPTVNMTIYEINQSPQGQGAPPEQETGALPTSVTLELGQTSVSESGGTVTVTATLDAPAPADANGVSLGLYPGGSSTATRNSDYTMPDTLTIAAGQSSGTASIVITNDAVDESDETVTVGVFADTGYATLAADATLTITDDDTAGVSITAANPLSVSEGTTATYTVVLDSQPTADVTIAATSGDTGAASVSPASYTFTSSTWSTALTFTVSGVADTDTNDETVSVNHSVTSTDTQYANALVSTVSVSVSDTTTPPPQQQNRAPTVASAFSDATIVNESGTHQVSLSGTFSDADSDALTITASSSDTAKATVSVASDYSSLTVTAKARGTATITVTANDGKGGTVSDAFTITVKAAPAVASALSDLRLSSGDYRELSVSGVFTDADGDTLTYSVEVSDSTVAVTYLFQGTLSVVAEADGTATITVTAQDSDGNTVSDAFDVSVVGPPSPATNLSCIAKTDQVAFLWNEPEWSGGDVYAYDLNLTMPDGSSETVRWHGYPAVNKPGEYQAGTEASISIKVVYELADGSQVSSAAAALTCTIAE